MKKLLLVSLLCSAIALAQVTSTTPNIGLYIPGTNSQAWQVPLDFNFQWLDQLISVQVSGLPQALSYPNLFLIVKDGTSSTDCTVGGGTYAVPCISNGSTWVAESIGSGGGGGGLPSCTTNQLLFMATSGTTASCLTLGTNLSITSAILNATGGSGMVYPGAGIPISTGSSWGTSLAGATAGDIVYYNGTAWIKLAGNNSGTQVLQETSSGVPSWVTLSGGGNVSSSGTPLQYQFPVWTNSTTVLGIGPCTINYAIVGGGGSANPNCNGTVAFASVVGGPNSYSGGELPFAATSSNLNIGITTASPGSPTMGFVHRASSNTGSWFWGNGTGGSSVQMNLSSGGILSLGSVYCLPSSGCDTGLSRDGAGVWDFGNGTAGNKNGSWKALQGTLGVAGTTTGILGLGNSSGSNYTYFEAGASAPGLIYIWPTVSPTAAQILAAAAPSGGSSQLSWVNQSSGSSSFTAPGTGAVAVPFTGTSTQAVPNQTTGTTLIAADYGVVADADITSSGTVTGPGGSGSPTDNCTPLTNLFSLTTGLGISGQVKVIFPAGGIATSCKVPTLGNGSSSAFSTINSVTLEGAGGLQADILAGFVGSLYPNTYYLAQRGGTEFIYTGASNLTTTPFFTVQGPIDHVVMKGLGFNCRYLCQTAVYFNSLQNSYIDDVVAIDTGTVSNIYRGAIWIDALSTGTQPAGWYGSQGNRFARIGRRGHSVNVKYVGISVGCGNVSICTDDFDVSGNHFEFFISDDPSGIGKDLVLNYEDSNTFDDTFVNNWYINMLSNSFPGTSEVAGGGNIEEGPGFMTSWVTSASIPISYTPGTVSFTTTAGSFSTTPAAGMFIQIDSEIMLITSVSGTIPTAMTIVAARGASAYLPGQIMAAHSSGAIIEGPYLPAIDGTGTCNTSGSALYFSSAETFDGIPVGSRIDNQMSQGVCGVSGITESGYRFDSPNTVTTASNPFIFSLHAPTGSISNSTSPTYFSSLNTNYLAQVPPSFTDLTGQTGVFVGQGSVIHAYGRILATNTTGSTASVYGAVQFTVAAGPYSLQAPSGVPSLSGSGGMATIDFDIKVSIQYTDPTTPSQGNLLVTGTWGYAASTGGILYPFVITGALADEFLSTGIGVNMGCAFSTASVDLSCVLQDFKVEALTPNIYGIN